MTRILALKQVLDRVEPQRELWCAPQQGKLRAGDVRKLIENSGEFLQRVRGRHVALCARTEQDLAPLLILLDGACRQLALLPTTLPDDRLAEIIVRSRSDVLVTTDHQSFVPAGVELCAVAVSLLWSHDSATGGGGVYLRNPLEVGSQDGAVAADGPALDSASKESTAQAATRWVLATSGTTGEPKLVAHTLASLTRTAQQDVHKGREFRWGSLYNLTGFAGLQVFLQSWCGGSCLILGTEGASLEDRVAGLIAGGCTALSATPTMWRKLLMSCPVERLALRQITLGGEIVDQKILDVLRHTFPRAKIVHIYASTEAGVGFAVRDGAAGFPESYLSDPPPGIRLAVDPDGRLLLRSDCDEQQYVDGPANLKRDDGFVDTGDLVARHGDRFYFLGRANGTINVGGNKVHPEEVEDFLLSCDGVRFARVTGRKSSFTGELVQAEVVVDSGRAVDPVAFKKDLLTRCRAKLEAFKVPAVVKIVDQMESTSSGKLKRTT